MMAGIDDEDLPEIGGEIGVLAQRLDFDLESGVAGGDDLVPPGFEAFLPPAPAARGHPEAVDENDGVGS